MALGSPGGAGAHTHTESEITDLTHADADAIHDNVGGEIAAITGKTTPVDADVALIEDSAASNAKKSLTWANVKATLKTYFDTLYATAATGVTNGNSHDHNGGDGAQVDHGGLAGLADDDHTQYLNTTRHDSHDHSTALGTAIAEDLSDVTAWTSWTPSYTNLTVGNGTVTAVYKQFGNLYFVRWTFVLGSTSSISGNVVISGLPGTPHDDGSSGNMPGGSLWMNDATGSRYPGYARLSGAGSLVPHAINTSSTYATGSNLSSTVPFTWATSDSISLFHAYRAT